VENQEKEKFRTEEQLMLQHAAEAFVAQHPVGTLGTPLGFNLVQLAQGSSIPLLALLPSNDQTRLNSAIGTSVNSYMDGLEGGSKSYFYKWSDGLLLVNTPDWFIDPVQVIPSSLWASLHPDKSGHIPLKEFANLMKKTSEDQAQWFATEVKMQHFSELRSCLLQLAKEPRLLSNQGVNLVPDAARSVVPANIQMPSDPHTRYRMRELPGGAGDGNTTQLRVEAQSPGQERWQVVNVLQLPLYVPASAPVTAVQVK